MKKYFLIIFGTMVFLEVGICAEAPDTAWTRKFGELEIGYSVQQTQDGGYIMTGDRGSCIGFKGIPLIKTDSLGNKEWYKTHSIIDSVGYGYSVRETQDGGYIVTGIIGGDVALLKVDSLGNKEWGKRFGGDNCDMGYSVQQTQDNGYIVTGYTYSYGAGQSDVWLIKTDSLGNKKWDKTFGGEHSEKSYSVQQTQDGGYIITGKTYDISGDFEVWLIKADSLGDKEWDKAFFGGGSYSVQQTQDGGYVITGVSNPNNKAFLIKTDSLGNKEWEKIFNGTPGGKAGYSVVLIFNGGYFIVGYYEGGRIWAIRTDISGDMLWTKIWGIPEGYHIGYSGQQTRDGGYIITGTTSPTAPPTGEKLWLIKLESDAGIEESKIDSPNEFLLSQNSSNPFINSTEIKFGLPKNSDVNVSIYNLVGKKVTTLIDEPRNTGCYTTKWDATDNSGERVATGIYFAKLSARVENKTYTKTEKLCLMR